jgi:hypothetical protein
MTVSRDSSALAVDVFGAAVGAARTAHMIGSGDVATERLGRMQGLAHDGASAWTGVRGGARLLIAKSTPLAAPTTLQGPLRAKLVVLAAPPRPRIVSTYSILLRSQHAQQQ